MKLTSMPVSFTILTALTLPVVLIVVLGTRILPGHVPRLSELFSHNARSTGGAADSQLKVPCEEPPAQSHQPSEAKAAPEGKAPLEKIVSAEGDDKGEIIGHETIHSNYLRLYSVRSLLVSDSQGRSEDPFGERPTGQHLKEVFYDFTGENSLMLTAPVDETYTVTFQSTGETVTLNLVRGQNNHVPDMAMRYKDLVLPVGVTARIKLTAQGVEPLQLDKDGDGTFETTVKPDAAVTGAAARDLSAPTICFGESKRSANSLITLAAADSSGVEAIYYSLDALKKDGMGFRLYGGPFEVDAARTPIIYAFADDGVGNRSGIYNFKVSR